MKHWVGRFLGSVWGVSRLQKKGLKLCRRSIGEGLHIQRRILTVSYNEYVEHLKLSVEDCIKKYCVLNELFERKTAIKINGLISS
jgi:hypothetical protein